MARPKKFPRHEGMLELHREPSLRKLDTGSCSGKDDIHALMKDYRQYIDVAQSWFYIDTGIPLALFPHADGYVWCIPDNTKNSTKYRWLSNKALKFEAHVVERLNQKYGGAEDVDAPESR